MGALACQLAACAPSAVVTKAVTLPAVAPALLEPVKAPLCDLSVKEEYSVEEIEASRKCWKAAFGDVRNRHNSLRSAVRVREQAATALAKGD